MKSNFALFKLAEEGDEVNYSDTLGDAFQISTKMYKLFGTSPKLVQFLKAIKRPFAAASAAMSVAEFADNPSKNIASLVDAAATVGALVNPIAKSFNIGWSASRAIGLDTAVSDLLSSATDDAEAIRLETIGDLLLAATKATDSKKALYLVDSAMSQLVSLRDDIQAKKSGAKFDALIAISNFERALLQLKNSIDEKTRTTHSKYDRLLSELSGKLRSLSNVKSGDSTASIAKSDELVSAAIAELQSEPPSGHRDRLIESLSAVREQLLRLSSK